MKRKLLSAMLVVATGMLLSGCNDSDSTTPAEPTAPAAPSSFSSNISGTWSGNLATAAATPVIVTVNQATSDATVALALTGTVSIGGGAAVPMTGTKDGNSWSLSGSGGALIVVVHQTLTSATKSTGDFRYETGGVTVSAGLNLTKS